MKRHIIICDDDSVMIEAMEKVICGDAELEIVGKGKNGVEAMELVRSKKPDLILLDLFMPVMDGFEVLSSINRNYQQENRPKVIVVTGIARDAVISRIFELGADHYILKPIRSHVLLERVHEVLDGSRPSSAAVLPEDLREARKYTEDDGGIERVTDALLRLGIPVNLNGFQYLRDAIMIAAERPQVMNAVTKVLYPTVAKMNNTTPFRVERSIRSAISIAWNRCRESVIERLFGGTVDPERGKPTNSEFIALIADRVRIRQRL